MVQAGFPSEELRDEHTTRRPARLRPARAQARGREEIHVQLRSLHVDVAGRVHRRPGRRRRARARASAASACTSGSAMGGRARRAFDPPAPAREVFDELMATGAVVVGRRTFDYAGHWNGDHHDGVPIFVPTRGEPPEQPRPSSSTTSPTASRAPCGRPRRPLATRTSWCTAPTSRSRSCARARSTSCEIHLIPVFWATGGGCSSTSAPITSSSSPSASSRLPGVTHLRYRVMA